MLAQPENLVQLQDLARLAVLLVPVHPVVLAVPFRLAVLVDQFHLGAPVALCLLCRLQVPEFPVFLVALARLVVLGDQFHLGALVVLVVLVALCLLCRL